MVHGISTNISARYSQHPVAKHPQASHENSAPKNVEKDRFTPSNEHQEKSITKKSPEEEKADEAVIKKLEDRDREVRSHEQAHLAAAGSLAREGPSYDYQTGPNGKRYAIGGEVNIDTSPGKTPEETITKADQIAKAALAPADPSAKDRSVAAEAQAMKAKAQQELASQKHEEASNSYKSASNFFGNHESEHPLINLQA